MSSRPRGQLGVCTTGHITDSIRERPSLRSSRSPPTQWHLSTLARKHHYYRMTGEVPKDHAQAVALFNQRVEKFKKDVAAYEQQKGSMNEEEKNAKLQSLIDAEESLERLKEYNKSNGEFAEIFREYKALNDEGVMAEMDLATRLRLLEKIVGLMTTLDAMRKRV